MTDPRSPVTPRGTELSEHRSRSLRQYSMGDRTAAVALATVKGDKAAARELGIPRRTLSRWHSSQSPALVAVRVEAARSLVDEYAEIEREALAQVRATLPTARADHAARVLEVVADHAALLRGEVTARTESANLNIGLDLAGVGDAEIATLQAQLQVALGEDPVPALLDALRHLTPEQRDRLAASLDGIVS